MSTFIDIHAIHALPPSNLNRDDTGAPKTALFGGAMRHRVSSQSWKRAVRQWFSDGAIYDNLGTRTLDVGDLVVDKMAHYGAELDDDSKKVVRQAVLKALSASSSDSKKSKKSSDDAEDAEETSSDKTAALFFVSNDQVDAVARLLAEAEDIKKVKPETIKTAFVDGISADIALFGRMVAGDRHLSVDAAVQFAHAISTHAVETEFDYYTAVDEHKQDSNGAAMIGDIEFSSSTLYRYATVNLDILRQHFDNDFADQIVANFIRAFVLSTPNGKQNTFAARTLPDFVRVSVRNQPVSMAGAFEQPVPASDEGFTQESARRLVDRMEEVDKAYDLNPIATFDFGAGVGSSMEETNRLLLETLSGR